MIRGFGSLLLRVVVVALLIPSTPSIAQDLDSWELGIMYPNEDADIPFDVSKEGNVRVEFFVENSGFVEISVEFAYDIPFGGEHAGPDSDTIPAGTNETYDLEISGIDVFNFEARKIESFSITATVTERQGVPDLLNSQQNREGDLIIPTIYDLRIDVGEPIGPMNAGSDTILRVEVTNTGNVQDKVGDVQVSDDCPLLTTDNGLDALMVGNIQPGKKVEGDLRATASESHPKRHCDITVTVSSNGAMNTGGSVVVSDEARVSVEPPLRDSDTGDSVDDEGSTSESVKSNLPASSAILTASSLFCGAAFGSRRQKKPPL